MGRFIRAPAAVAHAALTALLGARGHLMPWAPVFLSIGIGLYFGAHLEPPVWALALVGVWLSGAVACGIRGPEMARVPAIGAALIAAGFLLAAARAHLVAAPVLTFRYYGAVEGRIIDIDRSFSDQLRLTLDQIRLEDTPPSRTPARVRVALFGDRPDYVPEPGQYVRVIANLSPPDGPVAPGGFDFQRLAWFSKLGGVGYTRKPVEITQVARPGFSLMAFRMRMALSRAMQRQMTGQAGAFAAALMTGDRSAVTSETNNDLRASNLSHIISISGLHMGLLSGFVFALCRYGLSLIPALALRLNSKKLAALLALFAATFYMILAGSDVATRRSYIMAATMLAAVLFDRRALSLRSVAVAALLCLFLEPESLVEPGFQMSFGATAALIVGFEFWTPIQAQVPAVLRPVAVAVLSSLIAGTATAPIAAAHFNRIAEYGLLANLAAVPVMGLLVMPAGVMAALLAPIGWAGPALWVLQLGCSIILLISTSVAGLAGAVVHVPAPPAGVLPLFGLCGALLLIGRNRWLCMTGLTGLTLAAALWSLTDRPALLISSDGTLAGLMTEQGRALSKEKGGGFIAQNWLEDDGDGADQAAAFLRPAFSGPKGARSASVDGKNLLIFTGKGAGLRAAQSCKEGALVILSEDWIAPIGPCLLFDRRRLAASGALALYPSGTGWKIVSARQWAGSRLWNTRPHRARDPDN